MDNFSEAVQSIVSSPNQESDFSNAVQSILPTSNNSWDSFKNKANKIAQENNFPSNVLLGQAALETGHGTSNFAKERNNYFGYQAYDSNPDAAKSYSSPEQSINDYIDLIKSTPRYSWAYNQYLQDHDSTKLLMNIWKSGYATDPNYVEKVMSTPEFQGK